VIDSAAAAGADTVPMPITAPAFSRDGARPAAQADWRIAVFSPRPVAPDRHPNDGRRSEFVLTSSGESLIRTVEPIAQANRRQALEGIDAEQVAQLRAVLNRIMENCDARR
jgi:hypothetical protein